MTEHSQSAEALPAGHRAISKALLEARLAARALPGFPGEPPATLAEAYDIQDASRARWPDALAGWKVGGVPPDRRSHYGASFLAGPIFAATVVLAKPGAVSDMPVFDQGFAAIEPEFVLRLGKTRADDELFIGAELASSPVPDLNGYGPAAVVSDFGNNRGLLIGPQVENWANHSGGLTVETVIDGTSVGVRTFDDIRECIVAPRDFLLEHASTRSIETPPGTYISCGAITGVHEASVGARSQLDFGSLGSVDLRLVAAAPV